MSVPDRFHISWKNNLAEVKNSSGVFTGVTLASTVAAETAYPLTNCQNPNANEKTVIDMTGETTVAITDTDSPDVLRAINCAGWHNHNFPDGTTVRLSLFDAINQGGTTVYDSGEVDSDHTIPWGSVISGIDAIEGNFEDEGNFKTHKSLWFDVVECKSYKVEITNSAGFTSDQLAVDKIHVGFAYCPRYGPEFGHDSIGVDTSEHQRKPGGGLETVENDTYRTLNLEFKGMTNAERHVIRNILNRAKKGGDVLITMDPNDLRSMNYELTSIYRRASNAGFRSNYYNGNSFALSLEEN